jgi:hypothetical protein
MISYNHRVDFVLAESDTSRGRAQAGDPVTQRCCREVASEVFAGTTRKLAGERDAGFHFTGFCSDINSLLYFGG